MRIEEINSGMGMMKKKLILQSILLLLININLLPLVWAWDDETTHRDLAEQATKQSILGTPDSPVLRIFGFSKSIDEILPWEYQACGNKTGKNNCTVLDWLQYGAQKEDTEKQLMWQGRFENHFHNPITDEGLSDWQVQTKMSSVVWAQNSLAKLPMRHLLEIKVGQPHPACIMTR